VATKSVRRNQGVTKNGGTEGRAEVGLEGGREEEKGWGTYTEVSAW
jgi:hypothetical protein